MLIYHYTNKDNLNKISVRHYGDNYYTSNDIKLSSLPRSFFYTLPLPESLLKNSDYLYICKVHKDEIYDGIKDSLGLFNGNTSIGYALITLKKAGYYGIKYRGESCNVISLFYDIKVSSKIYLREE